MANLPHITIREASPTDIDTVMQLINAGRSIMRAGGNLHQWSGGNPDKHTLMRDIERRHSYLCMAGGQAVGTFALMEGPDSTYNRIYHGAWADDTRPYHVIHRIAGTPHCHGIFKAILQFALSIADNIRIDTHRQNLIMQHLLQTNGFDYCGIIYLENGDERLAYQLLVPPIH
ncbi:MAG TPA: N-acetyltransferase [Prevotella sp.]